MTSVRLEAVVACPRHTASRSGMYGSVSALNPEESSLASVTRLAAVDRSPAKM
jgi:hypothetical protein